MPSLLLYSIDHTGLPWNRVGGDYIRVHIPGGGDHWGHLQAGYYRGWQVGGAL